MLDTPTCPDGALHSLKLLRDCLHRKWKDISAETLVNVKTQLVSLEEIFLRSCCLVEFSNQCIAEVWSSDDHVGLGARA